MSIIQFLRILWAYRFLMLLTVTATAIGGVIAILVVPTSYEAKTRVMLNTLKPDPVTGEVIPSNASRAYLTTQKELIRDYGVAGEAAERLGWLDQPDVIQQYGASNDQDNNLRRNMAQRIIDRTRVDVVSGTNILEIIFRAPTPDNARSMANALRDAYIETTLNGRRREATRNGDWYAAQAEKERILLNQADAAKREFERANNIVMQDSTTDIETARLRALSGSGAGIPVASPTYVPQSSPATIQLAQLDAQIAQSSKTFGPNHPAMIAMNAQRATLAKVVADDAAASRAAQAAASQAVAASAGAVTRALSEQTTKVIANREKIEQLTQLQATVNLHRGQMEKALARTAELRQEAAVADSGIAVLSEAIAPRAPSFPNKPLIFGGAIGLGAGIGLLLSLILELVRRKVRGVEDLENSFDAPLLAVISTQPLPPGSPALAAVTGMVRPRGRRAEAA
ncbi:hypothetical protein [uncultured Phenylobacterium sp.]|uniref:GumC family protein n=1 Tax=uncultured Phenylobacterium sp. TaxID=349273 RepID=UPI0025F3CDFC|nr:hypothetical protein [uncultured Phenylobacterium sp.]